VNRDSGTASAHGGWLRRLPWEGSQGEILVHMRLL